MKKLFISITIFLLVQPIFAAVDVSEFHFGENTTLKPTGLLQVWGVGNQNITAKDESIRLRRAEIKVAGSITVNELRYFVMVDPSRLIVPAGAVPPPTISMVQDLAIGYKLIPQLELIVGQYKTPTTAEGLDPSSQLPLPERSYVGRTLGDKREAGVELVYRETSWTTSLMFSRGVPIGKENTLGGGLRDFDGRFDLRPTTQLTVGAFTTLGNYGFANKGRYGLNARYKHGKAKFRTEFAHAMDSGIPSDGMDSEVEYDFNDTIETVFRYEFYMPHSKNILSQAETVGVNYYLRDWNSKVQVSATLMQNMSAPSGTPTLTEGVNNQEILVALQASI